MKDAYSCCREIVSNQVDAADWWLMAMKLMVLFISVAFPVMALISSPDVTEFTGTPSRRNYARINGCLPAGGLNR